MRKHCPGLNQGCGCSDRHTSNSMGEALGPKSLVQVREHESLLNAGAAGLGEGSRYETFGRCA